MRGVMHGTRRLLDIALISAMGLLPLLWFKPGYNAIAGLTSRSI